VGKLSNRSRSLHQPLSSIRQRNSRNHRNGNNSWASLSTSGCADFVLALLTVVFQDSVEVIFTRTQEAAVFLEKLDETVRKRAELELDYGKRLQGFGKGLEQERG
jgi:hypothetical protein